MDYNEWLKENGKFYISEGLEIPDEETYYENPNNFAGGRSRKKTRKSKKVKKSKKSRASVKSRRRKSR